MQGTSSPRVSVGMPVYNGERYISEAIEALLSQTFTDFELIISDNGSIDRTEEICRAYAARDDRIHYHRHEQNNGVAWNYNLVYRLSSGDYFKWAAHDDVCAPEYLQRCVATLDAMSSVVLCHTKTIMIDENWNIPFAFDGKLRVAHSRPSVRFHDLIYKPGYCSHIHGLMRVSALRQTLLIGSFPSSDVALLAWLGLLGPFYEIPEGLFYNRRHAEQSPRDRYLSFVWFDRSKVGRIILPQWTLFLALIRAAWQTPLLGQERMICFWHLALWPAWNRNWRRLGKDLVRAAIHLSTSFARRPLGTQPS